MGKSKRWFELFAALSGFFGVVMGALAAHKAHNAYAAGLLQEASYYQLLHGIAILALAQRRNKAAQIACFLFCAGIVIFCGGLCVKALTDMVFGALIPVGGACFMFGWLAAAAIPLTWDVGAKEAYLAAKAKNGSSRTS